MKKENVIHKIFRLIITIEIIWLIFLIGELRGVKEISDLKIDHITQLKQNNIEQTEEKEVYRNRCKMLEDLLKANGLLDECECR